MTRLAWLHYSRVRGVTIPITSLQKDNDGRKMRFEKGVTSKESTSVAYDMEEILEEVNNLRQFSKLQSEKLKQFHSFQGTLMNALDSKIDGALMMMYKIVDELTKIKVHLGLTSIEAGKTSKAATTGPV